MKAKCPFKGPFRIQQLTSGQVKNDYLFIAPIEVLQEKEVLMIEARSLYWTDKRGTKGGGSYVMSPKVPQRIKRKRLEWICKALNEAFAKEK